MMLLRNHCDIVLWAKSDAYLYVLLVAVLVGRPGVVVAVEPGLPRQPAFVVEA